MQHQSHQGVERQQQQVQGDKVKENRKTLSAKTQKLIETTSAISDTLSQLERKSNSKRGDKNDLLKQLSSSSLLLEESLSVQNIAAQVFVPNVATSTTSTTPNNINSFLPSKPQQLQQQERKVEEVNNGHPLDINIIAASPVSKLDVAGAGDVTVEYHQAVLLDTAVNVPSRESVSLVEKIIEIEAPNLHSSDYRAAGSSSTTKESKEKLVREKEESVTNSQELKKKNSVSFTGLGKTNSKTDGSERRSSASSAQLNTEESTKGIPRSSVKKEKSVSSETLEEGGFPANVARRISIKKVEPISIKEKAPELDSGNQRNQPKDEPKNNVKSAAEAQKPEISTQTSLVKVDTKETDTADTGHSITTESKKLVCDFKQEILAPQLYEKIAELEKKLEESSKLHSQSQLAHSTLSSKFESAKHHNQDLQMRNSRLDLEIKSLLEQNETLRIEHRRIAELESNLRVRVIELSQPKSEPEKSPLDAFDQISQERILQQLDEQLGWISVHQEEGKENSFAGKHLRSFEDAFEILKKSVKAVSDFSPKASLNVCHNVSNIAIQSLKLSWDSSKLTHALESKLEALQQDARNAEKETKEKLRKVTETHDEAVSSLTASQKQLKQQFNGLLDKYKLVKDENEELRAANEELYADNQVLLGIVQKPDEPKEVVLLGDPNSKASGEHIESLNKANHELRLHVAQLNQTIESWKQENQSLQAELQKIIQEKSGQESQILKLSQNLASLENEVEEERLTSQKAAELIKSLQAEVEESKKTKQSSDFENQIENQMTSMQPLYAADSCGKDESLYEAQVLSFVKGTHEKVKHIQELESQIKDCNFTITRLEEENAKLKTKSAQAKDKFQVREIAWLERLKKSKEDVEAITMESQFLKNNLRSYKEQYDSIKALEGAITTSNNSTGSHPYPFAQIFNNLFHQSSLSSLKSQELEKKLLDTKHAYDDTSKDLLVQIKQFETLGSETKSTRNQLVEISGVKATLESKLGHLEENLRVAVAEKERAQEKLKIVIGKMIEFVQLNDE